MSILIPILTTVLVLNCFFLVLLILIQLPKKESGSGLAFGGGALDMTLGADAGNVLTRFTKYSASLFLLLCLILAVISNGGNKSVLSEGLEGLAPTAPSTPLDTTGTPASAPAPASTEVPATAPETTEPAENTETPAATEETTPAPTTDSTDSAAPPAKPAEGEENK